MTADPTADDSIVVYSDYVCPFCYLGRQSLAEYRDGRTERLVVDWRPFDLRARQRGPDGDVDHGADDGKDDAYYAQARENVRRLRAEYGVEMGRELATDVDSRPAQTVSLYLKEREGDATWLAFDRAVFEALWVDCRDVGDLAVLADCATAADLDPAVVRAALDDEAAFDRVDEAFAAARERGVAGVPTFEYGGHAARGAVPPAQLRRLVEGVRPGRDPAVDPSESED
jgi:predicted DsbA family dithiol-disulfide isomerase